MRVLSIWINGLANGPTERFSNFGSHIFFFYSFFFFFSRKILSTREKNGQRVFLLLYSWPSYSSNHRSHTIQNSFFFSYLKMILYIFINPHAYSKPKIRWNHAQAFRIHVSWDESIQIVSPNHWTNITQSKWQQQKT